MFVQFAFAFCVLTTASVATAATVLIEDKAAATAYIDRTFSAHECRMSKSAFFTKMEQDGVAPTTDDMARPTDGSLKIIRQRRVLAALQGLFASGDVCEDNADKTIAISKFGGCA